MVIQTSPWVHLPTHLKAPCIKRSPSAYNLFLLHYLQQYTDYCHRRSAIFHSLDPQTQIRLFGLLISIPGTDDMFIGSLAQKIVC